MFIIKGCLRKGFQVFEQQAKAKRRKTAGKIEVNLQKNRGAKDVVGS
jgi:hypothetical protein